jgi:hypothetical protein
MRTSWGLRLRKVSATMARCAAGDEDIAEHRRPRQSRIEEVFNHSHAGVVAGLASAVTDVRGEESAGPSNAVASSNEGLPRAAPCALPKTRPRVISIRGGCWMSQRRARRRPALWVIDHCRRETGPARPDRRADAASFDAKASGPPASAVERRVIGGAKPKRHRDPCEKCRSCVVVSVSWIPVRQVGAARKRHVSQRRGAKGGETAATKSRASGSQGAAAGAVAPRIQRAAHQAAARATSAGCETRNATCKRFQVLMAPISNVSCTCSASLNCDFSAS